MLSRNAVVRATEEVSAATMVCLLLKKTAMPWKDLFVSQCRLILYGLGLSCESSRLRLALKDDIPAPELNPGCHDDTHRLQKLLHFEQSESQEDRALIVKQAARCNT